ncbi:AfaD family invasin [Pantoea vagans]|uniref:AfaD family invasin n=1 Tax=Pantoea vagans TaxID=470934 RepID=UPI0028EE1892|nr:AfaD family invasin [Pantoea vagans]
MSYQKNFCLFLTVMTFALRPVIARAENLHLAVIPEVNLSAGKVADNTPLARIHISGISKNCDLSIWDEMAVNETIPGQYTLIDKLTGKKALDVRLTGYKWQPDTARGKGILKRIPGWNAEVNLVSNGAQFITAKTIPIELTAQCNATYLSQKENYQTHN